MLLILPHLFVLKDLLIHSGCYGRKPNRLLCPHKIFIFLFLTWPTSEIEQVSPAGADKPARRESMPKIAQIRRAYNVVADNTGLSSFVYLLLRPKSAKSREIH